MRVKEDAMARSNFPSGYDRVAGTDESAAALDGGLDRPTGRSVHIPSGITKRPIHYFIPDALRDLLMRCEVGSESAGTGMDEEVHAAALLYLVARRGYAGVRNPAQAGLLFDLLWQAPPIDTVADLDTIAARVDRKAQAIRQQIVFTGSPVASEALHVYAPHEAVPELMAQLVDGIALDATGVSAVDRVAVLGFFCVHAHPFRDGNGRWTRALTLAVERRSLVTTMAAMSFQTVCMQALAERIWPQARVQGLRAYLEVCAAYTDRLLETYRESSAFQVVRCVDDALRRVAKDRAKLRRLARCLFVTGRLAEGEVKQVLGVSSRVAGGLLQSLEHGGLTASPYGISIDALVDEIAGQAEASAQFALRNFKGMME
ncbi:Fic family protein [Marilutibacter maris]|uniref:Fic family protein n=1 Tax=Marilutibacter maris TaxID=1605891 RepID=UPI000DA704CB|nr:Fic family protein [Lysobacter maris]